MENNFKMVAITFFGMEEILAKELLDLGAQEIIKGNRSVTFKGDKGFGYDPIFITQNGMHLAELEKEEKNAISHRSLAFRELLKDLSKLTN